MSITINRLIGSVTRGEDANGKQCDILVDWVHDICGTPVAVRGRIVENGKLLRKKATHLLQRGFDVVSYTEIDPPTVPQSIAGRLRSLQPGDYVDAIGERRQAWRDAATRLKFDEGRTFVINTVHGGVRATRVR